VSMIWREKRKDVQTMGGMGSEV